MYKKNKFNNIMKINNLTKINNYNSPKVPNKRKKRYINNQDNNKKDPHKKI